MSETQHDKLKHLDRFRMILVFLAFVVPVGFTLAHLGFQPDSVHGNQDKTFLSTDILFFINTACGLFGGIVMSTGKRLMIMFTGILSGAVTTLATTAASILYFSWRTSIVSLEVVIPLGAGIITGVLTYKILTKIFSEREKKSYTP